MDTCLQICGCSSGPSHWCLFLCFQPLFPICSPSMKLTRTPSTSPVQGALSCLINYFPPLEGCWVWVQRGLCSLKHRRDPRWAKLGKPYSSVPSLPSWDRALLSPALHPGVAKTQGTFRSWSGVESKGLGDLLAAPGLYTVTCSGFGVRVR